MDARTIPKKPKRPRDVEEALREWEKRFQSLIELSSEWYWEQDEDCRFTLVTGTLGHSGIDPQKFIGTYRWDRGAVPVAGPTRSPCPWACSGAMYAGVPTTSPVRVGPGVSSVRLFARPKSVILG